MDDEQRVLHLDPEPMPRYGPGTITSHAELFEQLDKVARRGIAWEFGEFQDGATCAAAAVRDVSGALVGSVAVSAPNARFAHGRPEVEQALRATASRVSRFYRTNGETQAFGVIACRERCSMIARRRLLAWLGHVDALGGWELDMSDLKPALVRLLRAAFPHSNFPDGPYERVADKILSCDRRGPLPPAGARAGSRHPRASRTGRHPG